MASIKSGVQFTIRGDYSTKEYICSHGVIQNYFGTLLPFGKSFSEDTLCDMMEALENSTGVSNYRFETSQDDGDRFIESIVFDFVITFGRVLEDDDVILASMVMTTFDIYVFDILV